MKELGKYLKSTRISNGVSIEEAAEDLELSTSQLENIENGNTRAFNDVYNLRGYIKSYAKYLGLDPEKIADQFNDFLFEHTSKISLDDILEAQKKSESKQKKVSSPYTRIPKKKFPIMPIMLLILFIVIFSFVIYLIVSFMNKAPARSSELSSMPRKEVVYEFTY